MQNPPADLEQRVAALERTVADDRTAIDGGAGDETDRPVEGPEDDEDGPGSDPGLQDATTTDPSGSVESRLGALEDRVAELEATAQALRGYVGNVRSVNREVERRAEAALAKAESLESEDSDSSPCPRCGTAVSDTPGSDPRDTAAGADGDVGASGGTHGNPRAGEGRNPGAGPRPGGTGDGTPTVSLRDGTDAARATTFRGEETGGGEDRDFGHPGSTGGRNGDGSSGGILGRVRELF